MNPITSRWRLTVNLQRTASINFSCVTCVGAGVGSGTLQDLTEPLPAGGVDTAVLPWLQLLSILTRRRRNAGISHEFKLSPKPDRHMRVGSCCGGFVTLNHLTSMLCLENSHSRVAGKSSSTWTSVSVFRIDTGVSGRFQKSKQFSWSPEFNVNTTVPHH